MDFIDNSKLAAGVAMLLLNIGARYVQADLGKVHDMVLSNEYVKKLIVFCLFFVATRDFSIAFLLTIFYIIVIDGILHEKRKFCLVPKKYVSDTSISKSEYDRAKQMVAEFEKAPVPEKDGYSTYLSNLSVI